MTTEAMPARARALLTGIAVVAWLGIDRYYAVALHFPAFAQIVSAAFVASGLLACWIRPADRNGPLLMLVGFGNFAVLLPAYDPAWLFSLIAPVNGLGTTLLTYGILAFPYGRLQRGWHWVVVAWYFTQNQGLPWFLVPFTDPAPLCHCQHQNLWLISAHNTWVQDWGATWQKWAALPLTPAILAILLHRFATGSRPMRRVLTPVLVITILSILADKLFLAVTTGFYGYDLGWHPSPDSLRLLQNLDRTGALCLPAGLLLGVLLRRRLRGRISQLVVEIGDSPSPADLQAALRRALSDPTLVVAVRAADGGYRDPAGNVTTWDASRGVTSLESRGRTLGVVVHDPALSEDPGLRETLAATARLTVDNERLRAELQEQIDEVRASRARLVQAADEERRRVERDLHDGAQQRLVTLALRLQTAQQAAAGDKRMSTMLAEASSELSTALAELRDLARGILPPILLESGLGPALRSLARRSPLPTRVLATPTGRLDPAVEAAAYYVASEALTNAGKHAHAQEATIRASVSGNGFVLAVADDGVGIAGAGGNGQSGGSGLRGLADRVRALGGDLDVRSAPGGGTMVTATIPLKEPAER